MTPRSGSKIIDGLKDAVAGNLSRVTIDGEVWVKANTVSVRASTPPSEEEIAQAICKAAGWDWKDEVTLNAGFMSCARAVLALLSPKGSSEPMPSEDVNNLDEVVHELGIEDSHETPAEAVRKLKTEIGGLRAWQRARLETQDLDGAEIGRLRTAMQEACDLLTERKQGSHARSPGHNARLVLEAAITPGSGEPTLTCPEGLHPETKKLVSEFAEAIAEKLRGAEIKYGYRDGWRTQDWREECKQHLHNHIAKGDPLDVAAYCAFMWRRGWVTANDPTSVKTPTERPAGSNADEWHLYLAENTDALPMVAVGIAESMEAAAAAIWTEFVAHCEALEAGADRDLEKPNCSAQAEGFSRGVRHAAKSIRRSVEHPKYARPAPVVSSGEPGR